MAGYTRHFPYIPERNNAILNRLEHFRFDTRWEHYRPEILQSSTRGDRATIFGLLPVRFLLIKLKQSSNQLDSIGCSSPWPISCCLQDSRYSGKVNNGC